MIEPVSIIAVGDCHGAFLTLQALLAKVETHMAGKPYRVHLLGDLEDRGPRSKEVISWAMRNRVPTTKGNHEHLLVDYVQGTLLYEREIWLVRGNGGRETLKSFGGSVPQEVVVWLDQLPLYIIPPEYPQLLLSHNGHGLGTTQARGFSEMMDVDTLWGRSLRFPNDGYYRIFGHHKVKEPVVTPTYAIIDTGASYEGYGKLTAMIYPSKEIIQADYCD